MIFLGITQINSEIHQGRGSRRLRLADLQPCSVAITFDLRVELPFNVADTKFVKDHFDAQGAITVSLRHPRRAMSPEADKAVIDFSAKNSALVVYLPQTGYDSLTIFCLDGN
jgi:hypothetical protein